MLECISCKKVHELHDINLHEIICVCNIVIQDGINRLGIELGSMEDDIFKELFNGGSCPRTPTTNISWNTNLTSKANTKEN